MLDCEKGFTVNNNNKG